MNWQEHLQPGEQLLWQGRPAPRCYTFRNWKLALAGVLLFLLSSFWQMLGLQLADGDYSWYLALLPLPLVIATFCIGPGQLLLARWQWEKLFYGLSDRRLLLQQGLLGRRVTSLPLSEIVGWQQKRYGEQLASVRIQRRDGKPVILACLEQPQLLFEQLERLQDGRQIGKSV